MQKAALATRPPPTGLRRSQLLSCGGRGCGTVSSLSPFSRVITGVVGRLAYPRKGEFADGKRSRGDSAAEPRPVPPSAPPGRERLQLFECVPGASCHSGERILRHRHGKARLAPEQLVEAA